MSENLLPKTIEPKRLAEQEARLSGGIALENMSRLLSKIVCAPELAQVTMHGGIDIEGWAFLKGKIEVCIQLQCQRCMQPYNEQLSVDFCLVPVNQEHVAKRLPEHYEELWVEDYTIEMATLVEDELLLALPIVPRHVDGDCSVQLSNQDQTIEFDKKPNPFVVLAALKQKKQER